MISAIRRTRSSITSRSSDRDTWLGACCVVGGRVRLRPMMGGCSEEKKPSSEPLLAVTNTPRLARLRVVAWTMACARLSLVALVLVGLVAGSVRATCAAAIAINRSPLVRTRSQDDLGGKTVSRAEGSSRPSRGGSAFDAPEGASDDTPESQAVDDADTASAGQQSATASIANDMRAHLKRRQKVRRPPCLQRMPHARYAPRATDTDRAHPTVPAR